MPALIRCLGARSDHVRREAAAALARAGGSAAQTALPALIALLEAKSDDLVKDAALAALIRLGPEAAPALPALERMRPGAGPLLEDQIDQAIAAIRARR